MISRAALALALFTLTAPAIAQTQAPDGRELFQQGRELFQQNRFAEALAAFRASLSALPSPNTRLYLARCLRAQGNNAAAYREFTTAAAEANRRRTTDPRYARTADAATSEAVALTDRISFVRVEFPEVPPQGMTVTLNGRPLDATELQTSIAIDGRSATIEAVAPGHVAYRATGEIPPGQQARFVVRFAQGTVVSPDPHSPLTLVRVTPVGGQSVETTNSRGWRIAGIVTLSTGAALGVVGLVTGLRARSIDDQLSTECPNGSCSPTLTPAQRSLISDGHTMVTATNVSLIAGGALAAFGVVALIVSATSSVEQFSPGLARLSPYIDPAHGAAGLGFTTQF